MANLNFAPAEGKVPVNFMDQKQWDIKSWPTLHLDGKFGRDHKRKVKLTTQNYLQRTVEGGGQVRLLNISLDILACFN